MGSDHGESIGILTKADALMWIDCRDISVNLSWAIYQDEDKYYCFQFQDMTIWPPTMDKRKRPFDASIWVGIVEEVQFNPDGTAQAHTQPMWEVRKYYDEIEDAKELWTQLKVDPISYLIRVALD